MSRPRVAHLITQLELGGAQENTLYTVAHLDRALFDPVLIKGPGGVLDAKAARLEGVHVETSPSLARPLRPHRDLAALGDLVRRLRRLAPDVVHTHSSKAGILGRLAASLAGVPVVVHTVHGWGFTPAQTAVARSLFVGLERAVAPLTTRLVAVSRANAEAGAARHIAPRDAFTILHSGVELERFRRSADSGRLRRELGLAEGTPLIGMIACLKPQKSPLDFVRVVRSALDALPDLHAVLVGDGALRGEVEELSRSLGLAGRLHLLGWRDDPEVVMGDLDVLVLTSLHEGLPRVVPEAMAAGKPVVATAVDGTPEAVEPGVTGFLRAYGDVDGLARDVVALLRDPALCASFGAAARERCAPWDIDEMVRAQERLYLELLRGWHGGERAA